MKIKNNKKYYKKFGIGYNGSHNFFDKIVLPFKKYLSSVYTVPPFSSGIPNARWALNDSAAKLSAFRKKLKSEGISFNLVFNFNGLVRPDLSVARKLILIADYLKPDLVTVSNSFVMDAFLTYTDYKLNISIIYDIESIYQLGLLFEKDKDNQIMFYNISRNRTFDLDYIKTVKNIYPKLKLKLMVNEGCLYKCPDQNFHSSSLTMSKGRIDKADNIFFCGKLGPEKQWLFLAGQYIAPKFLANYSELMDEYKLGSRNFSNSQIKKILKEYINQEDITIARAMESSHGGSLFYHHKPLNKSALKPYPENFFEKRISCSHNCFQCMYCSKLLKAERKN